MKKIFLIIAVLLFLLLSSFFYTKREDSQNVLDYLGKEKDFILSKYGRPSLIESAGGGGGEMLYYEEEKLAFIFSDLEKDIVNNIILLPGRDILGAKVGMRFDEIENIIGKPKKRTLDPYQNDYIMIYEIKDGDIEIWFSANSDNSPTEMAEVFWKGYWD